MGRASHAAVESLGVGAGTVSRRRGPALALCPPPASEPVRGLGAAHVLLLGVLCGAALGPGLFVGEYVFLSACARGIEWVAPKAAAGDLSPAGLEALVTFLGTRVLADTAFLQEVLGRAFAGLMTAGALSGYAGALLAVTAATRRLDRRLALGGLAAAALAATSPAGLLTPSLPAPYALLFWPSLAVLAFGLACTIGLVAGTARARVL